jgi:hypothetical protein
MAHSRRLTSQDGDRVFGRETVFELDQSARWWFLIDEQPKACYGTAHPTNPAIPGFGKEEPAHEHSALAPFAEAVASTSIAAQISGMVAATPQP